MTRANLNFLYFNESENQEERGFKCLFFYKNGDQYPTGLKNFYNVRSWLEADWTSENFAEWIKANYSREDEEATPEDLPDSQPKIYYTGGFSTDYSYVFDGTMGEKKVIVFEWAEKVFEGNAKQFMEWIEELEKKES